MNSKRIFTIAMVLVLSVLIAVTMFACNQDDNTEDQNPTNTTCTTHEFSDWTVFQSATCTVDGIKSRQCSVCHYTEKDVIPAPGHVFGDYTVVTAVGCESDGLRTRQCSVCNIIDRDITKATGHKYGKWDTIEEATCEEQGTKKCVCEYCQGEKSEKIDIVDHQYQNDGRCKWCEEEADPFVITLVTHLGNETSTNTIDTYPIDSTIGDLKDNMVLIAAFGEKVFEKIEYNKTDVTTDTTTGLIYNGTYDVYFREMNPIEVNFVYDIVGQNVQVTTLNVDKDVTIESYLGNLDGMYRAQNLKISKVEDDGTELTDLNVKFSENGIYFFYIEEIGVESTIKVYANSTLIIDESDSLEEGTTVEEYIEMYLEEYRALTSEEITITSVTLDGETITDYTEEVQDGDYVVNIDIDVVSVTLRLYICDTLYDENTDQAYLPASTNISDVIEALNQVFDEEDGDAVIKKILKDESEINAPYEEEFEDSGVYDFYFILVVSGSDPLCDHEYQYASQQKTCYKVGYNIGTCKKCGSVIYDSMEECSGHNFVDGICTECQTPENEAEYIYYEITSMGIPSEASKLAYFEDGTTVKAFFDGVFSLYDIFYEGMASYSVTINGAIAEDTDVLIDGETYTMTITIDQGGHVHTYVFDREIQVTCDDDGYLVYTCSVCTDEQKFLTQAAKGHLFNQNGTCVRCGESNIQHDSINIGYYINMHDRVEGFGNATFEDNDTIQDVIDDVADYYINSYGYTVDYVTCDGETVTDYSDIIEEDAEYKIYLVTTCTHTNMEDDVVDPTCTEEGYTLHSCQDCLYYYEDTITQMVEHSYDTNDICSECDAKRNATGTIKVNVKYYINNKEFDCSIEDCEISNNYTLKDLNDYIATPYWEEYKDDTFGDIELTVDRIMSQGSELDDDTVVLTDGMTIDIYYTGTLPEAINVSLYVYVDDNEDYTEEIENYYKRGTLSEMFDISYLLSVYDVDRVLKNGVEFEDWETEEINSSYEICLFLVSKE